LYSVIASEAKQSILPREERMDCFVASLLAMTVNYLSSSFRDAPSWAQASDAQLRIGESITTIVSVDSGFSLSRAPE
jgi:hypothetical protein